MNKPMTTGLLMTLLLIAQVAAQDQPAQLELDEPTNVKVIIEPNATIEEHRHKGALVMVKVIPKKGQPYYIFPQEHRLPNLSGQDLINSGVRPVHWTLKEF